MSCLSHWICLVWLKLLVLKCIHSRANLVLQYRRRSCKIYRIEIKSDFLINSTHALKMNTQLAWSPYTNKIPFTYWVTSLTTSFPMRFSFLFPMAHHSNSRAHSLAPSWSLKVRFNGKKGWQAGGPFPYLRALPGGVVFSSAVCRTDLSWPNCRSSFLGD